MKFKSVMASRGCRKEDNCLDFRLESSKEGDFLEDLSGDWEIILP